MDQISRLSLIKKAITQFWDLNEKNVLKIEKFESLKSEFAATKLIITQFADVYSSAWNNAEELNFLNQTTVPKYHPCKKYYDEIKDDDVDNAMFCMKIGRHLCTKYCCKELKYKH